MNEINDMFFFDKKGSTILIRQPGKESDLYAYQRRDSVCTLTSGEIVQLRHGKITKGSVRLPAERSNQSCKRIQPVVLPANYLS